MPLQLDEADLHAKAVELGLIYASQELPANLRSRVAVALLQERTARDGGGEPQLAKEIVIQPNGSILVDGEPLPWLVANEAMDIHLNPGGPSSVRMTLLAEAVQIIKPEPREESE